MRRQLTVLHCLSLLVSGACASEPAEPGTLAPPATGPAPVLVDSGSAALVRDGGAQPPDAGATQQPTGGNSDASAALPQRGAEPATGAAVQGDAGAEAGAPSQADAGARAGCPTKYTTALRIDIDLSWPDAIGYVAGKGISQAWVKIAHTATADGTTFEAMPCGVDLPVVTTSPLLNGVQIGSEIPVSAFDQPTMPRFPGRARWQDGALVLEPGANVIGAALADPAAGWPLREALAVADHDNDGKPGVTARQLRESPFAAPPVNLAMTKFIDAVYVASRSTFRLKAAREGCSERVEGSVEPLAFDYTIVGCHVLDGGDCEKREIDLLNRQSPVFEVGSSGQWTSVPIDERASCAQVRQALSAQ